MKTVRMIVLLSVLLLSLGVVACNPAEPTTTDPAYTIAMTMAPETPTINNANVMTITVTDKDGKAVTGATVTVDPQMPAHGHGSSKEPKYKELGDGKYEASPVWFQMKGEWEVTVTVKVGETTASKAFKMTI